MKVGFIQFHVQFGDKQSNLNAVDRLMRQSRADLWVLPELFNTGYIFTSRGELENLAEPIPEGDTVQFLIGLAREQNTHIVAGIAEKHDDLFYNSAVLVNPNGVMGTYRKIHLFDREKNWFAPGNLPFRVWDIGSAKVGLMICFDWIFPEAARTLALKGAEVICHPSNLVLPYCQNAMVTRCLENRIFAITANRIGTEQRGDTLLAFTGASQITGTKGEILYRASNDSEEAAIIEIDPLVAHDKWITSNNPIFDDRRPEMYELR
ncbi:MAG: acyltransferase [candidate division KSB1 bacterium]|nr:acyltransferase [candidate division KSB1 bacterium]MDZ7334839.1 acyltransferase [candidate division KSB1 bacterium]MDZ7357880.1 acyltransferase [candidate division KSB1 bacterium]